MLTVPWGYQHYIYSSHCQRSQGWLDVLITAAIIYTNGLYISPTAKKLTANFLFPNKNSVAHLKMLTELAQVSDLSVVT